MKKIKDWKRDCLPFRHTQSDNNSTTVADLKWENGILKGIVQRQAKQIASMSNKLTQLQVRSMENNVLISSLTGDNKQEDCKAKVIEFLKSKVEIDVGEDEIFVAHRKGNKNNGDRQMLVRCALPLRDRILQNSKNLKEKKNENGEKYYINRQLPESVIEENRERRQTIQEQKELDHNLPPKERSKITVVNKTVHIDGMAVEKQLLLASAY